MLIFDVEIERAIPSKNHPPEPDIEYAAGWSDYLGMGISVIAAYDYREGRPRVFLKDNIDEFIVLYEDSDVVAGFNSEHFDVKLLDAHEFGKPDNHYDLYLAIKAAAEANQWRPGYKLGDCARANLGMDKTSDGAQAPILWQRGYHGKVIDYALNDIMMLKGLMDMVLKGTPLIDPGHPTKRIFVEPPRQLPDKGTN